MSFLSTERRCWLWVALYAVAMAWLEAAVVFYLRLLAGGHMDPYQPNTFPQQPGIAPVELAREAATLVMLLVVGGLAGQSGRTRLGYALVAFGIWDIFYYVFLKVITGWPNSLLDWDILFLIPLPWWGPVVAPVSIAGLMIGWGTLVTQTESAGQRLRFGWTVRSLCALGVLLALGAFMADALRSVRAGQGLEQLRNTLPTGFHWPLFLSAWLLMAAPVLHGALQCWRRRRPAD
jgi:hypothetical protein